MTTTHISDGVQVATFRLATEWFGIDVLRVQEVMNPLPRTEVPRAPGFVTGLINVRGLIVTAISLKTRLGFPDTVYDRDSHMNVIVNTTEGPVCLQVDEIGDVVRTNALSFAERPPTVSTALREHIAGVLRLEDRLITLLDVDRLVA
jgi:purine-binding chemotaxis protein CheW